MLYCRTISPFCTTEPSAPRGQQNRNCTYSFTFLSADNNVNKSYFLRFLVNIINKCKKSSFLDLLFLISSFAMKRIFFILNVWTSLIHTGEKDNERDLFFQYRTFTVDSNLNLWTFLIKSHVLGDSMGHLYTF